MDGLHIVSRQGIGHVKGVPVIRHVLSPSRPVPSPPDVNDPLGAKLIAGKLKWQAQKALEQLEGTWHFAGVGHNTRNVALVLWSA